MDNFNEPGCIQLSQEALQLLSEDDAALACPLPISTEWTAKLYRMSSQAQVCVRVRVLQGG